MTKTSDPVALDQWYAIETVTHVTTEPKRTRLLGQDIVVRRERDGAPVVREIGPDGAGGDPLPVREPEEPVYGTLNFLIEGYDLEAVKTMVVEDIRARLKTRGKQYGLVRHDGFLMHFPGKNFMLANISHLIDSVDTIGIPLLRAAPAVLSTEELLEQVWDENADPFTNAVFLTLSRLRRKLGQPPTIETQPGVGYRITDPGETPR